MDKENFTCGKLLVKSIFEKSPFFEIFSLLHKLVNFVYFFRKRLDKEKSRFLFVFFEKICKTKKKAYENFLFRNL